MDLGSITTTFSALKAAKDLGTALVELRDFNQVATTVTELNRELLRAQEGLFTLQAKLLELQSEHVEVLDKLQKFKKGAEDRSRYVLVELGQGVFAYRLKSAEHRQDESSVHGNEPDHYICQLCMDIREHKSVLMRGSDGFFHVSLNCPSCGVKFLTGEDIPMRPLNPGSAFSR